MKLKYRITILFTVLVSTILLLVCISVYYFSSLSRQNEFRTRIKNRALTTIRLLKKVPGINESLLRQIDEKTLVSLEQKSVVIYNGSGKIIYAYTDEHTQPVLANDKIIDRAISRKEYYFSVDKKDAVAISLSDAKNTTIIVSAALDQIGYSKLYELQLILFLSFIVSVLITFFSGLLFSIQIVNPIKKVTKEVNEISSLQLSRRIEVTTTKDELNELIHTINNLMNRLQESFEIQKRFITNASHELSTPLTAILNQLEITLQNERNDEEYKTVILSVYEDVKNMAQLTRSLLEIAKASGTSYGIELNLIRIDELLINMPLLIKKINANYIVELNFSSFPENEDLMMIFGNSDLLISAIKNIILNACKYSNNNQANVSLSFTNEVIQIEIKDSGSGINEEDIPYIFQPFFRGKNVLGKHGSGLGLPLSLRIVNMHKGSIEFKNLQPSGSCFLITLPIAKQFHKL